VTTGTGVGTATRHDVKAASVVGEVLFTLRNEAGRLAEALRPHVEAAQQYLDHLEELAAVAEGAAELFDASAYSDREFGQAFVPAESGLIRPDRPNGGRRPEAEVVDEVERAREAGRRAIKVHEAIPYNHKLTDNEIREHVGRAALGIEATDA